MPMPDGTPMNEYRARRDYFIGQALAGLCANPNITASLDMAEIARRAICTAYATIEAIAELTPPPIRSK
jgi:hypothetical protein